MFRVLRRVIPPGVDIIWQILKKGPPRRFGGDPPWGGGELPPMPPLPPVPPPDVDRDELPPPRQAEPEREPEYCDPQTLECVYDDPSGRAIRDRELRAAGLETAGMSEARKWQVYRDTKEFEEQDRPFGDLDELPTIDVPPGVPVPRPAPVPGPRPGPVGRPAPVPVPPVPPPVVRIDLGRELRDILVRRLLQDARARPQPRPGLRPVPGQNLAPQPGPAPVGNLQPLTAIEARRVECAEASPRRQRKRKRKARTECWKGSYIETSKSRTLRRRVRVSCITGKELKS